MMMMIDLKEEIHKCVKDDFNPDKRKRVGSYVLGKPIGEGSFAKVHIGVHLLSKERVAIKVIHKKLVKRQDYIRKNMRREGAALQSLDHPNIARLYEIMETDNSFYIVMELVEGGDMMKYLNDRSGVSESEARRFMRQIVSAVDHMHRSGVVHRDLKVENLLLNRERNIKIIDFGLSNFYDGKNLLSTQCGSPAYAAPEIFNMDKYGPEVDVWSLGVDLYAMVTGQLPFTVEPPTNISKLYATILRGCKIPATVSAGCGDLIKRMLEINVKRRISVAEIMKHPWLNAEYIPLEPWPIKQAIPPDQMDNKVMTYMRDVLSQSESDIEAALSTSRPTAMYATYCLLLRRLDNKLGLPDEDSVVRKALKNGQVTSKDNNNEETTPRKGEDTSQVTRTGNNDSQQVLSPRSDKNSRIAPRNIKGEKHSNQMKLNGVVATATDNCSVALSKDKLPKLDLKHNQKDPGDKFAPDVINTARLEQIRINKDRADLILTKESRRKCAAVSNNPGASLPTGDGSSGRSATSRVKNRLDPVILTAGDIRRLSDRFLTGQMISDRFAPRNRQQSTGDVGRRRTGQQETPDRRQEERYRYGRPAHYTRIEEGIGRKLIPVKANPRYVRKKITTDTRAERIAPGKTTTINPEPTIGRRAMTSPNITNGLQKHLKDRTNYLPPTDMIDTVNFKELGIAYHLPLKRRSVPNTNEPKTAEVSTVPADTSSQTTNSSSQSRKPTKLAYYTQPHPNVGRSRTLTEMKGSCKKRVIINPFPLTEAPAPGHRGFV